ncbi:hypothetical protein CHCC20327_2816 [Bacillus licheniformis]|nr:hypothetical protein CHCC20327_2816 [Bacillus licheniformis]
MHAYRNRAGYTFNGKCYGCKFGRRITNECDFNPDTTISIKEQICSFFFLKNYKGAFTNGSYQN